MCGGSGCQGSTVGRPRSGVALPAHYTTVEHNIRPTEGDDLSQSALSGSRNGRFSGRGWAAKSVLHEVVGEVFLGRDQVTVVVVAGFDLDPVDAAGEGDSCFR